MRTKANTAGPMAGTLRPAPAGGTLHGHEGGKYEKNSGGVKDEMGGQGHMSCPHSAATPLVKKQ